MIYHRVYSARLARRISLVDQEPLTLPDHPKTCLVFSGVRVA